MLRNSCKIGKRLFCNFSAELGYDIEGNVNSSKLAFIMHGIFGNRRNMRGLGNRLIEKCPNLSYLSLDHRGHGSSKARGSPNSITNCAHDVFHLQDRLGISPSIIIGHSFGGKVALKYAQICHNAQSPSNIKSIIILDTFPGILPEETLNSKHQPIKQVLNSLLSLKSRHLDGFTNHSDFSLKLQSAAHDVGYDMPNSISSWLSTNLIWLEEGDSTKTGKYHLTLDLDVISDLLASHWQTDMIPFLIDFASSFKQADFSLSIICAEHNQLWKEDNEAFNHLKHVQSITENSPLKIIEMKQVGHWLHSEKPNELVQLLLPLI